MKIWGMDQDMDIWNIGMVAMVEDTSIQSRKK